MIATSALAFAVVKWLGVAYLVWLGIRQWRAPPSRPMTVDAVERDADDAATHRRRGLAAQRRQPQGHGVHARRRSAVPDRRPSRSLPQYLVIAATLAFTDLVVNAGYAALAARLLGVLRTPARLRAVNRVFGSFFVALGVLLATFKRA